MSKCEWKLNLRLERIHLDGAVEHREDIRTILESLEGVSIAFTPPYGFESNGVAEHFNQELYLRARVLLTDKGFLDILWGQSTHHGNWLRNQLLF